MPDRPEPVTHIALARRRWLRGLSQAAAAVALGRVFGAPAWAAAPQAVRWPQDPFTLGVASGMPSPHGVVLWTRLAPQPLQPLGGVPASGPVAVRWELAHDEGFARVVARGEVLTDASRAYSVHVPVRGLAPDRRYHYRFISGGVSSPVGRTRTAPAAGAPVARLRLALASCQHYEQGLYAAHHEIAAQDLDLVLFVGDYIYESRFRHERIREHAGAVPRDLTGYRQRHAQYKTDPDLQASHAAHPWVLTWDDHEVENDYAGDDGAAAELPPEEFLAVRAAAYQAYYEHMPLAPHMTPRGPHMRIHERYDWGRLASLWTLDARQYRDPPACRRAGRGGGQLLTWCAEIDEPSRSVLGHAQERWLARGLATSPAQWKLLGNNSQMAPASIAQPLGRTIYSDWWDGYPAARERLLRHVASRRLANVVSLGGDTHRHVAAQLRVQPNDPASPVVASEFVCSSISSRGLPPRATRLLLANNPDMVHARSDERGYALLELDAQHVRCTFRATEHPVREAARMHTQAAYVVESGRAGVQADDGGWARSPQEPPAG